MSRSRPIRSLFLLAALAAVPAAFAGSGVETVTIADLAWISGTWVAGSGADRYEERWTPPASNAMPGTARRLSAGRMVFFEFLRIEARDNGIYYVAQPKGRPGTDFKLTRFDGREAVFENPEHNSPKRILYRRHPDGTLTARADNGEGVKEGAQVFSFRPMADRSMPGSGLR